MKKLLLLPLCLLPLACTTKEAPATAKPASTAAPAAAQAITGVHEVVCGCALEEIGKCGNYCDVDGKWVQFAPGAGLGVMEWCGQGEKKAEVTGQLVDGKVVATVVKTLD